MAQFLSFFKLEVVMTKENGGPKVQLSFPETTSDCPATADTSPLGVSGELAINDVIKVASDFLHNPNANGFYRQQSWKIIRAVILSVFRPQHEMDLDRWQDVLLRKLKYR